MVYTCHIKKLLIPFMAKIFEVDSKSNSKRKSSKNGQKIKSAFLTAIINANNGIIEIVIDITSKVSYNNSDILD